MVKAKKLISRPKEEKLKGIGGWLILVLIGAILGSIIWVFAFGVNAFLVLVGYGQLYEVVAMFVSLVMAFLTIYNLILLIKKRKEFPKWMIITLWSGVLVNLILGLIDGDFSDVAVSTISGIIWTWYVKVSKRVANTFVN